MDDKEWSPCHISWDILKTANEEEAQGEIEPIKELDEELLGRKYSAQPWVREILLQDLRRWLNDPKKGREWIWQNRVGLLVEGEVLSEKCAALLAMARKIAREEPGELIPPSAPAHSTQKGNEGGKQGVQEFLGD